MNHERYANEDHLVTTAATAASLREIPEATGSEETWK
jgi:hypothetical protein